MRAIGMPLPGLPAPALDELAPVLLAGSLERVAHELELAPVLRLVALAADQLKALKHEIGVGGVGRTVVADALDFPGLVRLPHFRAIHAELAGKPQQARHLVERGLAAVLVER